MKEDYDPDHVATFFDELGEREWLRFADGRTPPQSLDVHLDHLRRFVRPGDRVLDVGAGPGRFTIELARLGAAIVVADLSPGQLELEVKDGGWYVVDAEPDDPFTADPSGLWRRVLRRQRGDRTALAIDNQ